MSAPVILVRDLVKKFGPPGRQVTAVDGVSFTVERGQCVGLLGGNGAGKTTTIAMLLGLVSPTSGQIEVLGHDMRTSRFAALTRMNFTSPYLDLPHSLTVGENLDVYARLYGVVDVRGRISDLLGKFNLEHLRDRPAGKLSAGQKTRLGLAKALINKPEVLLLDEPTASQDPHTADQLRGTLEEYQKESGCTIFMASHNMLEVDRMCSLVLIMKDGKIVDRGRPADLIARYGRETLEAVFLAIARGEEMPT